MATAPAPRSARDFCSQCGFPTRGTRCDACGAPHDPLGDRDDTKVPTAETSPRPYGSPAESDVSGLDRAIDAFRAKDLPRFVEHLLLCEASAPPRAATTPDGPGWVATVRGSLLFVTLRSDEVLVEAPFARLPARNRLPALRLALELCAGSAASSRVAARGDLLLLRWSARLALLTPPVLRHHVREIAHLAGRYGSLLTVGLDARPPFADEQRSAAAFDMLGRPRRLHVGARRSIPPAPIPAQINPSKPRNGGGGGRPIPRSEGETTSPGLSPEEAAAVGATGGIPRPRHPLSDRPAKPAFAPETPGDAIPAVLSPMASSTRGTTTQTGTAPVLESGRRPSSVSYEPPSDGGARASGRTEIEIDTLSRRPGSPSMPSLGAVTASPPNPARADAALSPSDRLCLLLRHAQSLASLTLEERPATMVWLVRSAVFRAIYDFKDTLPDAVAQLYRCTGIGRDLPAPGTRVSGQLQAAEPALVVMERVIVARGQVPKEKPLAIEPMTSAAQAKDHVARYLGEIERAPGDPSLRHFLALGALTELLVRTKLPAQTDQRLRDIVSHAQREGAKSSAIDLMMTALQRINS